MIAQQVLDLRADDGFLTEDPYLPTAAPGVWEPTPPAYAPMLEPQFQHVRPFALHDRSQFLPQPPPDLSSPEYAADYNEVKLLGQDQSTVRTADETHFGHFWAKASPAGWSRIGSIVSDVQGYDLHDTARLMAVLNVAMADSFVVGW